MKQNIAALLLEKSCVFHSAYALNSKCSRNDKYRKQNKKVNLSSNFFSFFFFFNIIFVGQNLAACKATGPPDPRMNYI